MGKALGREHLQGQRVLLLEVSTGEAGKAEEDNQLYQGFGIHVVMLMET